ncbi:MAG TPA: acyl carrier protein [Streptosporangiaceae bacterium]|nr:acyl carrier protein [Streptosporangiaceae bacterium]
MTYSAIDPAFEAILRRRLSYLPQDEVLRPDDSLKDLGLDSMQAVELIFDIEDELGVVLPDELMTAQTFATAASLGAALAAASDQISAGTS